MISENENLPELLSREKIHRGRIIDLVVDTVREGQTVYTREVVQHPGGASVVAVFDDLTVALVKQYRQPPARFLLELPAGRLDADESPETCAARELEEEVGVRAGRLELLSDFYTTPGFCSERLWVFLATDLQKAEQQLEDDEIVEVVRLPLAQTLAMIAAREIEDAKTIIGLFFAAQRLGIATSGGNTVSL